MARPAVKRMPAAAILSFASPCYIGNTLERAGEPGQSRGRPSEEGLNDGDDADRDDHCRTRSGADRARSRARRQPTKAAGLVPVDDAKKTELEARVDAFVDDLVAQDVDSPEFGKRVDAITSMGQKEIREAAGAVEPLPRPPGARDGQGERRRRRPRPAAADGRKARPGEQRQVLRRRARLPRQDFRDQAHRLFRPV